MGQSAARLTVRSGTGEARRIVNGSCEGAIGGQVRSSGQPRAVKAAGQSSLLRYLPRERSCIYRIPPKQEQW